MAYPFLAPEKWDVHTHTTPSPDTFAALARFAHYADFVRVRTASSAGAGNSCGAELVNGRGEIVRRVEASAFDAAARLADCDRHRVTRQVISPTPMMIPDYVDHPADAAEICRILNDGAAALSAEHPERFVALAALPMLAGDLAIKELERAAGLGMRGIEVNSNVHGAELDDARFFPIFEAAAQLGLAVFIHPWGGFMTPAEEPLKTRMNAGRNWRPWLIGMGMETALAFDSMRCGGVHDRLPGLRVMYAHGGGALPALLGRFEHGAYCRPDLFGSPPPPNPFEMVRRCGVYADTLTHNPWALEMLIHTLGAERIAMGSDYPYPLGEIDPFDPESLEDASGNRSPYTVRKGIYPGHTIEHLPSSPAEMDAAWRHFFWLPRENADGPRTLPCLSESQKRRILAGTAREWLGIGE